MWWSSERFDSIEIEVNCIGNQIKEEIHIYFFRIKFERKQADDSEPIQTSRVVTDEVKNQFLYFRDQLFDS